MKILEHKKVEILFSELQLIQKPALTIVYTSILSIDHLVFIILLFIQYLFIYYN